MTSDDLGRARQAWATRTSFGIVAGQGRKDAIRNRIAEVRAELQATDNDPQVCQKLRERIGLLAGTSALVRVGARTPAEQAEVRLRVEAAVAAARLALKDGVVAGGGAALVACVPGLDKLKVAGDEGVGVRILATALAEPMRAIVDNAGYDSEVIVHQALRHSPGWMFDVCTHAWVDTSHGGPIDALAVTLAALDASVSAAVVTLSADVLVSRRSND